MAGIDFQEARRLADVALRPDWDPRYGETSDTPAGTFYVAPWGWEDAWAYQVVVGAQEYLEGGDILYAGTDDTVVLVTKASGKVRLESFLALEDRLESMARVGKGHPPE